MRLVSMVVDFYFDRSLFSNLVSACKIDTQNWFDPHWLQHWLGPHVIYVLTEKHKQRIQKLNNIEQFKTLYLELI